MTSLSTPGRDAGTEPRAASAAASSAASWAPLAVILCGTFVYVVDFFVVNVALPSIQRDLSASTGRHRVGGGRVRADQRGVPRHRGATR